MSFLGNIVSGVTKAVTDPGALVSDAAKAVLPKNMAAVADILGGIADVESGHPLKALTHLADALKDLPQLAQGQSGAQAKDAATPAGTPGAEPSPPPNKADQSSGADSASSPPTPQSPKVNLQMVGKQMVISIDDGTHTTVITEKPGQKPVVSVRTDKSPTTDPAPATPASGTASGTTPASTTPASTTAPGTTPASATTPDTTPASTTTPGTTPASTTPASTANNTTTGSTSISSVGASTASTSSSASPAPTPQSPKLTVEKIGRGNDHLHRQRQAHNRDRSPTWPAPNYQDPRRQASSVAGGRCGYQRHSVGDRRRFDTTWHQGDHDHCRVHAGGHIQHAGCRVDEARLDVERSTCGRRGRNQHLGRRRIERACRRE